MKTNAAAELINEAHEARTLLEAMRVALGQDDDAEQLTIASETNMIEAAEAVLYRMGELKTLVAAIDAQIDLMRARKERFETQSGRLKMALATAIDRAGVRRLETASATLSIKALPLKLLVTDEQEIPQEFWRVKAPDLDRTALTGALRQGRTVPGAQLDNGGNTLQIRYS